MNVTVMWTWAAVLLLLGLVPIGWVLVRGDVVSRVVAASFASTLAVLIIVVVEEGLARLSFFDLALALALLSLPSGLLYAYMFERWA